MSALSHPEDIKAALRKRYGSVVKFEESHGLPRNSARDVLRGRPVKRTAQAIARELNITVEVLSIICGESHNRDNSDQAPPPHRLNREAK